MTSPAQRSTKTGAILFGVAYWVHIPLKPTSMCGINFVGGGGGGGQSLVDLPRSQPAPSIHPFHVALLGDIWHSSDVWLWASVHSAYQVYGPASPNVATDFDQIWHQTFVRNRGVGGGRVSINPIIVRILKNDNWKPPLASCPLPPPPKKKTLILIAPASASPHGAIKTSSITCRTTTREDQVSANINYKNPRVSKFESEAWPRSSSSSEPWMFNLFQAKFFFLENLFSKWTASYFLNFAEK